MRETVVMGFELARVTTLDYRYAHISIIDPGGQCGYPEWPLAEDPNRVALLRVTFWDKRTGEAEWHGNNTDGYIPREAEVAPIVPFVLEWKDKVDGFVVNCAAGISRSTAVGVWLARVLDHSPEPFYAPPRNPNPVVIAHLTRAMLLL